MIKCVRKLKFDAGHRVFGHEGKCNYAHGHEYKVFIHAEAQELDSIGRVIDFSVLKSKIGTWIDDFLDHGFIIGKDDKEMEIALKLIKGQKLYFMPYNPTAENIARHLLREICPTLMHGTGVTVTKVVVHETENCYAYDEL
jgi:6-pyruvoyltetrahydropterin/6-carboxytetrahydropterin synthase